jgi:hypothetical protein
MVVASISPSQLGSSKISAIASATSLGTYIEKLRAWLAPQDAVTVCPVNYSGASDARFRAGGPAGPQSSPAAPPRTHGWASLPFRSRALMAIVDQPCTDPSMCY